MTTLRPEASRGHAWLQLLRAPNLLTVPGDPLAGWLLAGGAAGPALAFAVGAALCLYACGLITNDLADRKTDRRERPQRPLPSGQITPAAAWLAAGALAALALALSAAAGGRALALAGMLLLALLLYNFALKASLALGPVTMGLCRGLNLLLGAAASSVAWVDLPAARAWRLFGAAALLTLYITGVSALARREAQTGRAALIGQLLRGLLAVQAAFCLSAGAGWFGGLAAVVLLALWPVTGWLAKRFYMS